MKSATLPSFWEAYQSLDKNIKHKIRDDTICFRSSVYALGQPRHITTPRDVALLRFYILYGREDIKKKDVLKNAPVVNFNSQTIDIRDIGERLQLPQEINHRLLIRRCQRTETSDNFASFTSMSCRKLTVIRWANDILR